MIVEHGATVLPFTDALLRSPRKGTFTRCADDLPHDEQPLPDNVIVMARFARRASRAQRPHGLGGPPEGEAA